MKKQTQLSRRMAFLSAILLCTFGCTGLSHADTGYTNLADTTVGAEAGITESGILTLTNDTASTYSLPVSAGTLLKTGVEMQTLTGAVSIGGVAGSTSATISGGTLNLSGQTASLDSIGSVVVDSGAKLLFTGTTPRNMVNALTININAGGTLEFTEMEAGNHKAGNSLVQSPDATYNVNGITTKGITITGDGTLVKSGAGSLSMCVGVTGGTAKIALSSAGKIDIQKGTFVNGGWNYQNWQDNYATLNIGAEGVVDHWDGIVMQVGGLTGDSGAKMISGNGSTDANRGGFIIGAGTTSEQVFTYAGDVSLTNANSRFTKTGQGEQVITGAFSSGTTTVESGTLKLSGAVTVGAGGMSFNTGAVLDLSEATSFVVNGTLALQDKECSLKGLSGNASGVISGTGTLTLTNTASDGQIYAGIIEGARAVVYNDSSTKSKVLSGQSTFSGGLTISSGILRCGAGETLTDGVLTSSPFGIGTITLAGGTIQNHESNTPTFSNNIVLADGTASSLRAGWSTGLKFSGVISGSGQLQIANDSGTVTLMNTNTYTGGTQIGGGKNSTGGQGIIVLGADNALGTGPVTFGAANSVLDMNGFSAKIASVSGGNGTIKNASETLSTITFDNVSGEKTYGGLITGNVKLVVDYANGSPSANYLVLTGANTHTGGTEIAQGVVRVGVTEVLNADGLLISSALGTGAVTLSGGCLQNNNNTPTISNNIVLADGTVSALRVGWGKAANFSGQLSGSGQLDIAFDSGYVILSGDNSGFSGELVIGSTNYAETSAQFALVRVASENALGTGQITLAGGTIQNHESNTPTVANNIVLADGTASSLRAGWATGLKFSGVISGSGQLQIANDSGTVTLMNTNTYTGGTLIGGGKNSTSGQGTVVLGATNALGTGTVAFGANNSKLDLGGFDQTINGIDNSNGAGGYYTGNAITSTVGGTATAMNLTVAVAEGGNYVYSGTLPTVTSLTKNGAGVQRFTSALAAGTITVAGGTLELGVAPTTTTFDVQAGGTLKLDKTFPTSTGTLTGGGSVIVSDSGTGTVFNIDGAGFTGDFEIAKGVLCYDNSASFGTGTIILSGGTIQNYNSNTPTIPNNIVLADGTVSSFRAGWVTGLKLSGVISGNGELQIATDSGTVTLMNTNTYTGGTLIGGGKNSHSGGQGTVVLGAENALGTGAVAFGANNSSLDLGGFDQTIGGLETGAFTGVKIKNSGEAKTLTLDVAEGENYTWAGTFENPDKISVVKTGAGAQTIAAPTSVNSLTVTNGGIILSGNGVINSGTVVVDVGAYMSTDPNDGVFHTISNTNFLPAGQEAGTVSGTFAIQIASPTAASRFAFDQMPLFNQEDGFISLLIGDDVRLSTSAAFVVSNTNPTTDPAQEDLESWLTSDLRYEWNLTWDGANSAMTLQRDSAAVPEPGSMILLILGVLGGAVLVRKRNRG